MTIEERNEMIEKLMAEGMTEEQAEDAVAQAEDAVAQAEEEQNNAVEDDRVDDQAPEDNDESGDTEAPEGADTDRTSDETVPEGDPSETVEGDTFPREYVEKLRKESAGYREKAKRSDELARRLQVALVAADGRLADPEDLAFNEEYLEDPEALAEAIAELIGKKPGLRAQQVRGDVGQGKRGSGAKPKADLISILKGM